MLDEQPHQLLGCLLALLTPLLLLCVQRKLAERLTVRELTEVLSHLGRKTRLRLRSDILQELKDVLRGHTHFGCHPIADLEVTVSMHLQSAMCTASAVPVSKTQPGNATTQLTREPAATAAAPPASLPVSNSLQPIVVAAAVTSQSCGGVGATDSAPLKSIVPAASPHGYVTGPILQTAVPTANTVPSLPLVPDVMPAVPTATTLSAVTGAVVKHIKPWRLPCNQTQQEAVGDAAPGVLTADVQSIDANPPAFVELTDAVKQRYLELWDLLCAAGKNTEEYKRLKAAVAAMGLSDAQQQEMRWEPVFASDTAEIMR